MLTTIRYILLTALRDWLFAGLFVALFIAVSISTFLGSTALVEEAQMTTAFIAGSTRVILLVGLIIFVCFHVRRAFDNREVEVMLSRPISRTSFVLAYWAGFALVSLLLILPLVGFIAFFLQVNTIGLAYWAASVTLEAFLVVAFGLFSALILKSAVTSVLLCFGFYLISRMMGFFLFVIDAPRVFHGLDFSFIMNKLLWLVSLVLPRLDLLGKSEWLVYGMAEQTDYLIFLPTALIYIPLLLAMAVYDFKRRQF